MALASSADTHHNVSVECIALIREKNQHRYVSIPTVYETHRRLRYDFGYRPASRFLQDVYDGSINILLPSSDDEAYAKNLIEKYQSIRLSFTDAVNMAIMIRTGIARAFTFDSHYTVVGLLCIPPLFD
jgi:predicted nucleic acid-binding protein